MCFAIPKKITQIENGLAVTEDGMKIKLGSVSKISTGDYVRVYGNMAVDKVDKKEAEEIRRLIKKQV